MYQPNFLGSERKMNVLYRLAQENVQTKLFCMNIDITAPFINYHNFSKCLYHFCFQAEAHNGKWCKVHILPQFTLHSGIYTVIAQKSGGWSQHFLPHRMNQRVFSGKQRDLQVCPNYGNMNLDCENRLENFQKKKN